MATSRPFAYNTGVTITGTIQVGNLSIGTLTNTSDWLNIGPSTTAKAQINLEAGVAPTTPTGRFTVIAPEVVLIKYPTPDTAVTVVVLGVVSQFTAPLYVAPKPLDVAPAAKVTVSPEVPIVNVVLLV
jgi:hypothetical protein